MTTINNNNNDIDNLDIDQQLQHHREIYAKYNQDHVFKYVNELTIEQKQQLLYDIKHIDINNINDLIQQALNDEQKQHDMLIKSNNTIEPFTDILYSDKASQQDRQQWFNIGLQHIIHSNVACVLMSGGSGTRLKYDKPKGMYDIGLLSHKSIFQIHAEKILCLQSLAIRHAKKYNINMNNNITIQWYIMTNLSTHSIIIDYFTQHSYFGLSSTQIHFFEQDELPAYDINTQRIILHDKYKLSLSPNGNGGIYNAMYKHNILQHMKSNNIKYIHIYGIDNILIKPADPYLIGYMSYKQADIANKVVHKKHAHERVGVMCKHNNHISVLEYSEIPKQLCELTDNNNNLLYGAANIAQHAYTLDMLYKLANIQLPYHIARKSIQMYDINANTLIQQPTQSNAIKLEQFIFDGFQYTDNIVAYCVNRSDEFSAVKNANSNDKQTIVADSPQTALYDITQYNTKLIEAAGGTVRNNYNDIVEIDTLTTYDGENLEQYVKGNTFNAPVYIT